MILFVVILYLLFILINYISTKVAEKSVYEPITYQTWTTLGFFVLYLVLIIVFFYLGYLLGEWKFCILKGGSAINAGDWSITESFSDTYNTDRRSSRQHSLVSHKITSSRNSIKTEFGRIGGSKSRLDEPSSPRFKEENPPTPKRRGDSALFDKEMLKQLNKAISTNSTPLSSFDIEDPRRQSGGL